MSNEIEDLKNILSEIKADPSSLMSEDDKVISQIIRIEKKHLHGLEGSSERTRRDEIEKLIKDRVMKIGVKK